MAARRIIITLSSASMGDVDGTDFDCWRDFVDDTLSEAPWLEGYEVEVQQARFGGAGDDTCQVTGGKTLDEGRKDYELEEEILRWLGDEGWNDFCGIGGEWETRRARKLVHEWARDLARRDARVCAEHADDGLTFDGQWSGEHRTALDKLLGEEPDADQVERARSAYEAEGRRILAGKP